MRIYPVWFSLRRKKENHRRKIRKNLPRRSCRTRKSKRDAEALAKKLSQDLHDSDRLTEIALTLYNDLDSCVWAQPYIAAASLCGIVNGYGNGIFKPSGNITYNELAAMCVRAAGTDTSELAGAGLTAISPRRRNWGCIKG